MPDPLTSVGIEDEGKIVTYSSPKNLSSLRKRMMDPLSRDQS